MLIRRLFSSRKKNDENRDKLIKATEIGAGVTSGILGARILDSVHRSGELSGKVHMYHGTSKKNKQSILEKGLKGSKALDPDNLTNRYLFDVGKEDGRHLIYVGKKRSPAIKMALQHLIRNKERGTVLNVNIPYEDLKNMKRVYDNPEFRGTKDFEEFYKKASFRKDKKERRRLKKYYDEFSGAKGTKGTAIFEGDIDSKYIKGSKNYERNSLKQISKYIKNNPKRFMKGVGKTALGASLIGGGVLLSTGKLNKNKNDNTKTK